MVDHARGVFYSTLPMHCAPPLCRKTRSALVFTLAAACVTSSAGILSSAHARAPAPDHAWSDVEARIQYGYFTEDRRALGGVSTQIASGDARDHLKTYYAALLAWRLASLQATNNKAEALEGVERCVTSLNQSLELQQEFADALALQSLCLEMLGTLKPWRAPFAGRRSHEQIARALQLAPKNPRVLLLDAIGELERGGDKELAFGKLKKAVAAFERERQDVDHVPGWGAPDAYLFLARQYLDRGDAAAARDALERALLIAPDFAEARRLISRITSG